MPRSSRNKAQIGSRLDKNLLAYTTAASAVGVSLLALMARFGFALGWEAASLSRLVGWQKGDEFEASRLKTSGQ